ncbi:hypothetical protein HZ326_15637 [Fusarium oxysporum f. sp. albedinis]|nr:hypothetical protein HZ326_15637 [Fusarium oxysporum f. sp. albedinis]
MAFNKIYCPRRHFDDLGHCSIIPCELIPLLLHGATGRINFLSSVIVGQVYSAEPYVGVWTSLPKGAARTKRTSVLSSNDFYLATVLGQMFFHNKSQLK